MVVLRNCLGPRLRVDKGACRSWPRAAVGHRHVCRARMERIELLESVNGAANNWKSGMVDMRIGFTLESL